MERYVGRIFIRRDYDGSVDDPSYQGKVFLHGDMVGKSLHDYSFLFSEIVRAQENAMGNPTIDSIEIIIKSHDE